MNKATSSVLKFILGAFIADVVLGGSSAPPKKKSKSRRTHAEIKAATLVYLPFFQEACRTYPNVPLQIALATSHGEGVGNPAAVSSAGCVGLMQLKDTTARGLGLIVNSTVDERLDPRKNILAGVHLLSKLYKSYGDWDKVWAAYNSGNPDPDKRRAYINYIKSFLKYYAEY